MKLVYSATREPVKIGDRVTTERGLDCEVGYFRPPHKPSSSGYVTVLVDGQQQEYYVSVIGAEWIEREDRHE